jgi:riboflavin biosynthesis pyrimidine reductase
VHADARRRRGVVPHGHDVLARPLRRGRRPAARVPRGDPEVAGLTLQPLELLDERPGLPELDLPDELRRLYGGGVGFAEPALVANFVETVDGIVAIPDVPRSNALIAGGSEADRFVMGLLRACADVVLVGSGTMLGSPKGTWRADRAFPDAAAGFAELRRRLGKPEQPSVAFLTGGGSFDPTHPILETGALVLTTDAAAASLAAAVPAATEVLAVSSDDRVDVTGAVTALRARGAGVILSEGGPTLFASLLAAGLVDELFLTVSPLLAGRGARPRLGLVEGVELLPDATTPWQVRSVRRHGDHLFLRYLLAR